MVLTTTTVGNKIINERFRAKTWHKEYWPVRSTYNSLQTYNCHRNLSVPYMCRSSVGSCQLQREQRGSASYNENKEKVPAVARTKKSQLQQEQIERSSCNENKEKVPTATRTERKFQLQREQRESANCNENKVKELFLKRNTWLGFVANEINGGGMSCSLILPILHHFIIPVQGDWLTGNTHLKSDISL